MNLPFPRLPADEPTLSLPEFLSRVDTEPAFVRKMQAHYESYLQGNHGENIQTAARTALATLKHRRAVVQTRDKLEAASKILDALSVSSPAEELRRLHVLRSEAVDLTLDMLEPERTRFMKGLAGLAEDLRQLE